MSEMHIGDDIHGVDADGRVEVLAHQVETALSLGASHAPIVSAGGEADVNVRNSARLDALEAQVAELLKKKR
jgi:hypothetical protein